MKLLLAAERLIIHEKHSKCSISLSPFLYLLKIYEYLRLAVIWRKVLCLISVSLE